jgi:hypothetical protein
MSHAVENGRRISGNQALGIRIASPRLQIKMCAKIRPQTACCVLATKSLVNRMKKALLIFGTTALMGLWNFAIFAVVYFSPFFAALFYTLLLAPIPILYFWGARFFISASAYLCFFMVVLMTILEPWQGPNNLASPPISHHLLPFMLAYAVHVALLSGHSWIHRKLDESAHLPAKS